jgi:hypothetical protein
MARALSADRRALAASVALALFLIVGLASIVATYPASWRFLDDQHKEFADYSASDRLEAAGYANALPVGAFDFFRAHLERKERYYLAAPAGSYISGVDRPAALRAFARYYLLPAIAVQSPDQAEAIVSVGVDPKTLGLPLDRVIQSGREPIFVAQIQR